MRKYSWLAVLFAAALTPAARADSYIATFTCGSGDCFALPAVLFSPFTLPTDNTVEWALLRFPMQIPTVDTADKFFWVITFSSASALLEIRQGTPFMQSFDIAAGSTDCFTPTLPYCPYIFETDTEAQYGPVTFTSVTPEPSSEVLLLAGIAFLSAKRKRLPLSATRS